MPTKLEGFETKIRNYERLYFGGADEAWIENDTTGVSFNSGTDSYQIRFGDDGDGMDVALLSTTAAASVLWDQSAEALIFQGNSTVGAKLRLNVRPDNEPAAPRQRGDLFLVSNTTGLYLAVMRNTTTSSGVLLSTASTWG